MNEVNIGKIATAFLRSVRGTQSQDSLSDELGFDFNIVSRWESGSRGFYWLDFLELALVKRWDVATALNNVTHFDFSAQPDSSEILEKILVASAEDRLSIHFSKQKISRLSRGETKLLFEDFLLMLHVLFGRVERFLSHFVDLSNDTVLSELFSVGRKYREVLLKDPFLSLVRYALELEEYKKLTIHSDVVLAKIFKTTEQEIAFALQELEAAGAIKKIEGVYKVGNSFMDMGPQDKTLSRTIMNHWRRKIVESASNPEEVNPDLLFAYLIYPTNPGLDEEVFALCRKFYVDLKNLADSRSHEPMTSVRFVGIDLFYPLGKEPASGH